MLIFLIVIANTYQSNKKIHMIMNRIKSIEIDKNEWKHISLKLQ